MQFISTNNSLNNYLLRYFKYIESGFCLNSLTFKCFRRLLQNATQILRVNAQVVGKLIARCCRQLLFGGVVTTVATAYWTYRSMR